MNLWQVIGDRIRGYTSRNGRIRSMGLYALALLLALIGCAFALLGLYPLPGERMNTRRAVRWLWIARAVLLAGVLLWLSGCTIIMSPLVSTTREYHFYGPVDGATVTIEKQAKAGGLAK